MTASLSRRAALAGSTLAALGLGAPVTLAAAVEGKNPSTGPVISPEAAALQAEAGRLSREYRVASREADDTLDATAEVPLPEELFVRKGDAVMSPFRRPVDSWWTPGRRWWGDPDIIEGLRGESFRYLNGRLNEPGATRRDEIVGAWDRWKAAERAAEDASGHTAAQERYEAAFWAYHAFRLRLVEMRTADPEVMSTKALVLRDLVRDDDRLDRILSRAIKRDSGAYEDAIALSLARDFLGLLGADNRGGPAHG